jgi:hypothetical protein
LILIYWSKQKMWYSKFYELESAQIFICMITNEVGVEGA